jgi:hypothetical protein
MIDHYANKELYCVSTRGGIGTHIDIRFSKEFNLLTLWNIRNWNIRNWITDDFFWLLHQCVVHYPLIELEKDD